MAMTHRMFIPSRFIPPSTYYYLVYYRRRHEWLMITYLCCIIVGIIITLIWIRYLLDIYLDDVLVIGSGLYATYFANQLKRHGYRCRLFLPSYQHNIAYCVSPVSDKELPLYWMRQQEQDLVYSYLNDEDKETLSRKYNLSIDLIRQCYQELIDESIRLSEEEPGLYLITKPQLEDNRSIETTIYGCLENYNYQDNLHRLRINGRNYYGTTMISVENNNPFFLEAGFNLQEPLAIRVKQEYKLLKGKDTTSFFAEKEQVPVNRMIYLCRDDGSSWLSFNRDYPIRYDPDQNMFRLTEEICSLAPNFGLEELPETQSQVSHLFLKRNRSKQSRRNLFFLDTVDIWSSCPERDLLIVMKAIEKLLTQANIS